MIKISAAMPSLVLVLAATLAHGQALPYANPKGHGCASGYTSSGGYSCVKMGRSR